MTPLKTLCLLGYIAITCCSCLEASEALPLRSGEQKYREALTETDTEKKTALLNEALATYLPYVTKNPSGKLLSNIGDLYYSFGQYGYAIGYYRTALNLLPGDPLILHNLQVAMRTAQVENEQITEPLLEVVGYRWIKPNERGALAVGLIVVTFIIFSLNCWLPLKGFSIPWRVLLLCTAIYTMPMLLCAYFQEPRGVVLRATALKELPYQEAQDMTTSLSPGQMVYVEEIGEMRDMVQVRTTSGIRGTTQRENIMLVEYST